MTNIEWNDSLAHKLNVYTDLAYGDQTEQVLDIYCQGTQTGEPNGFVFSENVAKTVVHFHGGGWVGLNKSECSPWTYNFLKRGWNVVNVEYRLGPNTSPYAVLDCIAALRWVARHGNEYNLDTSNLVVTGASAGGHLALVSGMINTLPVQHERSVGSKISVRGIINWFGITNIDSLHTYLSHARPEQNYALEWAGDELTLKKLSQKWSPVALVTTDCPPILTIHGALDKIVPIDQAVQFHSMLDNKQVPNELLVLKNANHGGLSDADWRNSYKHVFNFLERHDQSGFLPGK